jgi:hypothetical protein
LSFPCFSPLCLRLDGVPPALLLGPIFFAKFFCLVAASLNRMC